MTTHQQMTPEARAFSEALFAQAGADIERVFGPADPSRLLNAPAPLGMWDRKPKAADRRDPDTDRAQNSTLFKHMSL